MKIQFLSDSVQYISENDQDTELLSYVSERYYRLSGYSVTFKQFRDTKHWRLLVPKDRLELFQKWTKANTSVDEVRLLAIEDFKLAVYLASL